MLIPIPSITVEKGCLAQWVPTCVPAEGFWFDFGDSRVVCVAETSSDTFSKLHMVPSTEYFSTQNNFPPAKQFKFPELSEHLVAKS